MQLFTIYLLLTLVFISPTLPSNAEIRVTSNTMTVNVSDTTMKNVLDDIRHQMDLNVVTFEGTKINTVKLSKRFWNLPLEVGFDRLLRGWNYGITRDGLTGKMTTLYLVSRRSDPSTSLIPETSTNQTVHHNTDEAAFQPSILTETEDDFESPDSERNQEDDEFTIGLGFSSNKKLPNLSTELREHLEKLYTNDNE